MDNFFHIEFVIPTGPGICQMLAQTDTTITFNGYFRIESTLPTRDRPIRRLMYRGGESHLIGITGIKRGKNTSQYFDDPFEGGKICLTPTEIIEIEYHILEANLSNARYSDLQFELMLAEKELRELNEELYHARMEKEIAEWKQSH